MKQEDLMYTAWAVGTTYPFMVSFAEKNNLVIPTYLEYEEFCLEQDMIMDSMFRGEML